MQESLLQPSSTFLQINLSIFVFSISTSRVFPPRIRESMDWTSHTDSSHESTVLSFFSFNFEDSVYQLINHGGGFGVTFTCFFDSFWTNAKRLHNTDAKRNEVDG
ncbi:unnamed protein product [Lactuca saligna]|uniref:Uncharacterized protein n=1 Tax=Lactuca saligna TaxID=75948 RepID=A0AA35YA35_LACSI|nr:unnamed protein product [Lactuca saligna]